MILFFVIVIFIILYFLLLIVFLKKRSKKDNLTQQSTDESFLHKQGEQGENRINYLINKYCLEYHHIISNGLFYDWNENSHEIDQILINKYGVFVIETKNWHGSLIGRDYDDEWLYIQNNLAEKRRAPVKQNEIHVQVIEEILNNDIPIKNIVVFINTNLEKVTSNYVYDEVSLIETINQPIKKYYSLSKEEIDEIYELLESYNDKSSENHLMHIRKIKLNNLYKN